MSASKKKLVRRISMVAAALGLLVPVTVSPGQGIEANEACADGSCCRELNSICMADGGSTMHYYESSGTCTAKRAM